MFAVKTETNTVCGSDIVTRQKPLQKHKNLNSLYSNTLKQAKNNASFILYPLSLICFTEIQQKIICDEAYRLKVMQFTENNLHYKSLLMELSTIFGTAIMYYGKQYCAVVFDI